MKPFFRTLHQPRDRPPTPLDMSPQPPGQFYAAAADPAKTSTSPFPSIAPPVVLRPSSVISRVPWPPRVLPPVGRQQSKVSIYMSSIGRDMFDARSRRGAAQGWQYLWEAPGKQWVRIRKKGSPPRVRKKSRKRDGKQKGTKKISKCNDM